MGLCCASRRRKVVLPVEDEAIVSGGGEESWVLRHFLIVRATLLKIYSPIHSGLSFTTWFKEDPWLRFPLPSLAERLPEA